MHLKYYEYEHENIHTDILGDYDIWKQPRISTSCNARRNMVQPWCGPNAAVQAEWQWLVARVDILDPHPQKPRLLTWTRPHSAMNWMTSI